MGRARNGIGVLRILDVIQVVGHLFLGLASNDGQWKSTFSSTSQGRKHLMEDLASCLRCGSELEFGVIVGQQLYLNWEPNDAEGGLTMHGREHLATGSARRGPRLKAARCPGCGLGYFQGGEGDQPA